MLIITALLVIYSGVGGIQYHPLSAEEAVDSMRIFEPIVRCHTLSADRLSCSNCIRLHHLCAWCADVGYGNITLLSRCDTYNQLSENGCKEIIFPRSLKNISQDLPLSNVGDTEDEEEAVQIRPQEMYLTLRPKESYTFQMRFKQAVDYPVDLYYLMDLSHSMSEDKDNLAKLGGALADRMRSITKSFRLGFGSFVDKKIVPYIDPKKKDSPPCRSCMPVYGFRNHMRLSTNTTQFSIEVANSKISGNLDAPEGGFDAIMQAIACNSEIGWRDRSRRVLLFSADAPFHFAGDGRLGGVLMQNDGSCHLDVEGYYKMTTEQDYPSVSQLHRRLLEHQTNLIFAVTADQQRLYGNLREILDGVPASVAELASDSSNIVDLVQNEYEKISSQVFMFDNVNRSQRMSMTYSTPCKGFQWKETNQCSDLKVDDEIIFNVTLTVHECLKAQRKFLITTGPAGLSDLLKIHLTVICDCDCENNIVQRAEECHSNGTLSCGVCSCYSPVTGRHCECYNPNQSTEELDAQCRSSNDSRTPICSDRGYCSCGQCFCLTRPDAPWQKIEGPFCQCDNFNCPSADRKLCSGNGDCICQQCHCYDGWLGDACDCLNRTDACVASNGKICNDAGSCVCGTCVCDPWADDGPFIGPTCEICPSCTSQCLTFQSCVMCRQWQTGPFNESHCGLECNDTDLFRIVAVDILPDENMTDPCNFIDPSDGCIFYYSFVQDVDNPKNLTVYVRIDKYCPLPVPILLIVLFVILGIILIGLLLLLCWKCFVVIHDRRELAIFERDTKLAKWDTGENPLFRPATSTFRNPTYQKF